MQNEGEQTLGRMSPFGVVVCLSLFVSSAYPAPAVSSGSLSVLKPEGSETKTEELKRLEIEKNVEYSSKEVDSIFKKLLIYVKAHYSDISQTSNLKCETIKEDKENFVFYKIKGKLYPKKKPVYDASIQPPLGFKKYFEISTEKKIYSRFDAHLEFNKSQNAKQLNNENRSVIEVQSGESDPANKHQLEEAFSSSTKTFFLRNESDEETTSTGVTKASKHQNINSTYSGYTPQAFYENISQSLQFTFENEYGLDNYTKENTISMFTIAHEPKTLSDKSSQTTVASFESNSNNLQNYEHAEEPIKTLYSSENKISQYSTSGADNYYKESSVNTTSNISSSNITKNGKETYNVGSYQPTTQRYEFNLTTYPYLTFFKDVDKSRNVTENDIKSTINDITPNPSLTDVSEKKVNQNHFLSQSDSTSSIRPDQLTTSSMAISLNTFTDDFPKHVKTTFNYSANRYYNYIELDTNTPFNIKESPTTERNFPSSSVIDLSYTPSAVTNGSLFYTSERYYKTNSSSKNLNYSIMPLVTGENKWYFSKEQSKSYTLFTSRLSLNKTTGYSNGSNVPLETKEYTTPFVKYSHISGLKYDPNKDNASSTPLVAIGVTKSVNEKGISFLNYSTTKDGTLEESIFVPTTSSNIPIQTSTTFEISSKTPYDNFQETVQSNKYEANPTQNQNSGPITNDYFPLSPGEDTRSFHYLTYGPEIQTITDHINTPTTENSQTIPISFQEIFQDNFSNTVTPPSLNTLNNETFYTDLYTSSSLSNHTALTRLIFDMANHSKGFFNSSQLEISNFGIEYENRSSPYYQLFNNSYFIGNTSITRKLYNNIFENSNETYEKETNGSTDFSTSSLHTIKSFTEHVSVDFQSDSPGSKTTQDIHESNETNLPVSSSYNNIIGKTEFSKEKTFFTSSLAEFMSRHPTDQSSIPLTTPMNLLTDKLDENGAFYNSNWNEVSTISAYEESSKNVDSSTPLITGSTKYNSDNYFLPPPTSSSAGDFGFTDSTGHNVTQSGAFSYRIDGNHKTIDDKENVTSGYVFVHDTDSTYYSHLNHSSLPHPLSSTFDNANITNRVTITSGNFYFTKQLIEKPNQPTLDYVIKNNTDNLIKTHTNDNYDFENSETSITETVEDEKVENLTIINLPNSGNITANEQSTVPPITSSIENDYPTPSKGFYDSSIIEISMTETNIIFPTTGNVSNDVIVTGKNEITNTLITFSDKDISVPDCKKKFLSVNTTTNLSPISYLATSFESNANTDEIQKLTSEWNSSILTTSDPHNLTIQGMYDERSSTIVTTEIQNYISSENVVSVETTTQWYTNLNNYSKESDSVITKNNSNQNLTTSATEYSTNHKKFTYTEKHEDVVKTIDKADTIITDKIEDIIVKTTPNSVIPVPVSNRYDEKTDEPSIKTTKTNHVTTSTDKTNEISNSDFEMSTQHYQTIPSFNNFTFLLPTTDYYTSYLPVRVHPLILFSEIK